MEARAAGSTAPYVVMAFFNPASSVTMGIVTMATHAVTTVVPGGVATVSSERSRAVKLQLDEDRLILSVNAPDSGAAEEELAVAYGDERLDIGFNAKYLLEIASQVDRENAVFMFNSSGDPTLMREGNDTSAVYVVMPMRF